MPQRPRIAFVHSILYFGSTEQSYLKTLLKRIDQREFELWLVAPAHPALAPLLELKELAGRVARLSLSVDTTVFDRIASYRRTLRSLRPDLVHCVDVDPPAMIAGRLAGVRRLVVTHHTPELRPRDNWRGRLVRRAAWETRSHVIFTSEADRTRALESHPISPERSTVVSLGIDLDRFSPERVRDGLRRELGIADGRPVVGTVGRLNSQKGHTYLIRAAEEMVHRGTDAVFVVVGEGDLRDELLREVRDRGLQDRFFFLGHREDVPELLAGFDVFALSSNFEGMCLAVAEALAIATPVVATDVGGVRQSVVPGETGLLVPPRDPDALARELVWVLEHPEEARRMALAGRRRVRQLYSLDRMVATTTDLYRRLLA